MSNFDAWLEPLDPEPTGECSECEAKEPECAECNGTGQVTLQRCDTCNSYSCHCDADYDAWKDSQYD